MLLITQAILLSCSSRQVREEKYDNGSPREKFEVKENKDGSFVKDGYFKKWHENGQLEISGEFKENQKEGEWIRYYSTGKIESKGSYEKDEKEGVWKDYYENGQLNSEITYSKGEIHGVYKQWYSDGQMAFEYTYERDKPNGPSTTWNEDGSIHTAYTYEYEQNITLVGSWINNIDIELTFYKDGKLDMLVPGKEEKISHQWKIEDDILSIGEVSYKILFMDDDEYKLQREGEIYTAKRIKK